MKVVVGLGNPGPKYAGTRHNVGFEVLELLVRNYHGGSVRTKFDAELCDIRIESETILLCAPQTFMNLSGRSVRQLVDFYRIEVAGVLVICDDMNLETGRLRLRQSGSAGGQKGLQNIIDHLGTQDVARLRIGIGRPPAHRDPAAYVLKKFTAAERESINVSLSQAVEGVAHWSSRGAEATMNLINAPPQEPENSHPTSES